MEPPISLFKENYAYRTFFSWFDVRHISLMFSCPIESLLNIRSFFSVCVISALRIAALQTVDFMDWPYESFSFVIWSILEPCLGIINACLFMMQPIVSKMTQFRPTIISKWTSCKNRFAIPHAFEFSFIHLSDHASSSSNKELPQYSTDTDTFRMHNVLLIFTNSILANHSISSCSNSRRLTPG